MQQTAIGCPDIVKEEGVVDRWWFPGVDFNPIIVELRWNYSSIIDINMMIDPKNGKAPNCLTAEHGEISPICNLYNKELRVKKINKNILMESNQT
ncbi:hypothetical protein DBV15_04365 [Temnothorax longispinosus]|uniref:Uncharacterized protein n=1 Tax=Temnothorax longispinosus TaxID=300112 RepID=A0A4S2KK77_9HYME|nr:hypothetical protein DBV15_04365 [Temnothorax longispinosus]